MDNIRNFCIIAHIDHGKSTLADRFLEITNTIDKRQMKSQYLDQLELERERGITIKMAPVRMIYNTQTVTDRTRTVTDERRTVADRTQTVADNKLLYEDITYKIRGAVFSVRKKLGLGHKEIIYQNALEIELKNLNLNFEREKSIDVFYEGKKVGVYRPDFIVEGKIIVELKTLPFISKQEEKQVWNYLRGTPYKLALLINFGPKEANIYRIVSDNDGGDDSQSLSVSCPQSSVYVLNLIDTPGHPDFGYEVSRALAAVEGAILLVDGTQGIQAQTLSNFYAAQKAGLKIIGAVNKIDLGSFDVEKAVKETASLLGVDESEISRISAKTGAGVKELLERLIEEVPPPQIQNHQQISRALIFDSFYDNHKGIVATVRVFEGSFKANQEVFLIAAKEKFKIKEVGYFTPHLSATDSLSEGEIGYLVTGIRDPHQVKIGDTVISLKAKSQTNKIGVSANQYFDSHQAALWALPGYREPKPVVFVSFYPDNPDEYENLKKSLERLKLNDSSFTFEPDANEVLGRGFKGGFLGKLHFEIILQRLEREFGVKTVTSFPSVAYKVKLPPASLKKDNLSRLEKDEEGFLIIRNPKDLPDNFLEIWEPMIRVEIIAPHHLLGSLLQLKEAFRWQEVNTKLIGEKVIIETKMPLAELISDFDDRLKSVSGGFASFSYQEEGYQKSDLAKLEILVAGEVVPGLSRILPKETLEKEARKMVLRLKEILPRQQFSQALQAKAQGRIIARETIPALKKDVTGYLYGGDRTRKMKLWKKQKEGKKKLLSLARVRISPQDFKKILSK